MAAPNHAMEARLYDALKHKKGFEKLWSCVQGGCASSVSFEYRQAYRITV